MPRVLIEANGTAKEPMSSDPYNRLWNSAYIKLCVIELCLQMGMQTTQTVTSNAALALGATVTVAGVLAGLSSAVALALRIATGRVVSRVPLKSMLVASAAIMFASSLAFGLISSVAVLGTTRVVYGVGLVIKSVLAVTVCVRIVPKESIGQAVAWLGMANILCVAAGPNLAQLIGLNIGYNWTFLFGAAMFACAAVLSASFPNLPLLESQDDARLADAGDGADSNSAGTRAAGSARNGAANSEQTAHAQGGLSALLARFIYFPMVPLAIMGLMEGAIFGIVNMLTLAVGDLRGMPETSLFFVVYVVVSFCMRPVLGKLYDKYGFARVCPPMCILMALSMVGFAFTDGLPMVILDGALFALGQGCLWPCLQAESVHGVPLDKSSLSTNTLLLGVDVGMTTGPMLGGAVLDASGPLWMYLFAAGIGVCLSLWTIPYIRIMKKRKTNSGAISVENGN